jgi:hypothetical protein
MPKPQSNGIGSIFRRQEWQVHVLPKAGAQEMTGQIVLMEPLGDNDNGASFGIVDSRTQGLLKERLHVIALRLGTGLIGVERIVDDDEIGAVAGDPSIDRRGAKTASQGCLKIRSRVVFGTKLHFRKDLPVPFTGNNLANLPRKLLGQVALMAHDNDADGRVSAEQPRWKENACQ